jgi:hypothetical protein
LATMVKYAESHLEENIEESILCGGCSMGNTVESVPRPCHCGKIMQSHNFDFSKWISGFVIIRRWNIETGYRYFKELLGFDQYQLLSFVGIERFWAIQFLTYNFLEFQRMEWSKASSSMTLGDVVNRIRQEYLGQIIVSVYQQALEHKPLKEILTWLKINVA